MTALKLLSDARDAIENVDIASKIDGDDGVVSLTLHFADSHDAARAAHRHRREARSALAKSESNAARKARDFALRINDVPVFCHGTCRTNTHPVSLRSSEAQPQHAFEPARDARKNMLRVSGTVAYESDTFYALADEHGRAHLATRRIGEFRLSERCGPTRPPQTCGHFQLIRASLITAAWRPARRDPTLATHIAKRGLLRAHPSFSFKADATLAARTAEVRALDAASATSTDTRTIRPPFARDVFANRVKPRAARTHSSGCAHHCRFFCDS